MEEILKRLDVLEQNLRCEINEVKHEMDEFKQEIQNVKDTLFVIEHEHGRKIDAMYDYLDLQNDKMKEKSRNIRNLDKRMERSEISIFNLEKRVTALEKSNS